jgi:peptidoglycan/LPS O-acetylase OafA/YrhL
MLVGVISISKNKNRTNGNDSHLSCLDFFCRDDWIRTSDHLHPMQVRYRTALRPELIYRVAKVGFYSNFQKYGNYFPYIGPLTSNSMIRSLTSLRFLFALLVFFHHCNFLKATPLYGSVFAEGYIGVGFFFVLSGFILAYTYAEKMGQRGAGIAKYYRLRFFRIYPLHWLTLLAVLPLFLYGGHLSAPVFLANLFLLQAFIPNDLFYFSYNAVSWSISAEIFFYALFPFLVRISPKRLGAMLLAGAAILLSVALASKGPEFQHYYLYIFPVSRLFDFMLGIGLYHIYKTGVCKEWKGLEIIAVGVFVLAFSLHNYIPQAFRFSLYYWIPISLLILAFAYEKGPLSRYLGGKVCVYLGEISFGFYMIHQLLMTYGHLLVERPLLKLHLTVSPWVLTPAYLLGAVALSALSYAYFEQPILRYAKALRVPGVRLGGVLTEPSRPVDHQ